MKKTVFKKVVAAVLSLAMVVTGLYVVAPKAEEVKAADSTASVVGYDATAFTQYWENGAPTMEGKVFAGWYTTEDCSTLITDEIRDWTAGAKYFAKFVDAGVLSVKVQLSADKTQMRVLSSVDSLDYKKVGFEVYFDGATTPVVFTTTQVFKTIDAKEGKVAYKYSNKVMDDDSEYFVSGTISGINPDNLDKNFYIRPFWVTADDSESKVFGQGKMFSVNDGVATDKFNITIPGVADPGTTSVDVTVGGKSATAEVVGYKDGNLFLNVAADKAALDSTSKVEYNGTAYVYNKLKSAKDVDTSWYDVNPDADVFYISSEADLWGLESLCKGSTALSFEGKTIVLLKDLKMNEGKASDWHANGVPETVKAWTALNTSGSASIFKGTFDGNGHTISGLYMPYVNDGTAFIGRMSGTLKNLKIANSYTKSNGVGNWYISAAVGRMEDGAAVDNVYVGEDVIVNGSAGSYAAGLVGVGLGTFSIKNSWFAGTCYTGATYGAGILAWGRNAAGYATIENCLVTGTVQTNSSTEGVGGIVGLCDMKATIKNTVFDGTLTTSLTANAGSVAGFLRHISIIEDVYTTNGLGASTVYGVGAVEADWPTKGLPNVALDGKNFVVKTYTANDFAGNAAFENLNLDFWNEEYNPDGVWVANAKGTPELRAFTTLKDNEIQQAYTGNKTICHFGWYVAGTYVNGAVEPNPADRPKNVTYYLETAADLRAMAGVVNDVTSGLAINENFSGDIVYLANDIDLNPGWVASATAPKNVWTPIGYNGANNWGFAGTFDGKGHKISGVYINSTGVDNQALFGKTGSSSYIKNFTISNSYISSAGVDKGTGELPHKGAWTAAVVGLLKGTLEGVYADETVTVYSTAGGAAGLVGQMDGGSTAYLKNSWFAGTVMTRIAVGGDARIAAGLVAGLWTAPDEGAIDNCLFTGTVDAKDFITAGIIGFVYDHVGVSNCISNGVIHSSSYNRTSGFYGNYEGTVRNTTTVNSYSASLLTRNGAVTIDNPYVGSTPLADREQGKQAFLTASALNGASAKVNTNLDFWSTTNTSGKWVATGHGPELAQFSKSARVYDYNVATITPDYSWFKGAIGLNKTDVAAGSEFTLTSVEQLYAFTDIVNQGVAFKDATIKLVADKEYIFNTGWDGAAPNASLLEWIPVGYIDKQFKGSFLGQDATIKGLYVASRSRDYNGFIGQIQANTSNNNVFSNLKMTNSYIESYGYTDWVVDPVNGKVKGMQTAAFVGRTYGSVSGLYADNTVTVISDQQAIGGIVGRYDSNANGISNCWFGGNLIGTSAKAEYVGGMIGQVWNAPNDIPMLENCLFTGNVKTVSQIAAGLIGDIYDTTLIRNCVVAGTVQCNSRIGYAVANVKYNTTLEGVYGIGELRNYAGTELVEEEINISSGKTLTGATTVVTTGIDSADSYKELDFATVWTITSNGPVLTQFQ